MCAKLLKPHDAQSHGRFYQASERAFDWILRRYENSLGWVLRHQPLTLAVTLATMAATVFLYAKVPKGFFPQQDTGRLNGSIQADQDTSFQAMQKKLAQFVDTVMRDPAVESANGFLGGTSNSGRMFVALKPRESRDVNADQVIARLRGKLAHVPGASLFLQPVQDLRIGGRGGGAQYQYTLQGDDPKELFQWAPRVMQGLRKLPELADVNSDQQNKGLQASLTIDRSTASRLGITPQMIDNTLYDAFGQRQVSTMYTQLNQYHVVMEVDPCSGRRRRGSNRSTSARTRGKWCRSRRSRSTRPTPAPLTVNHQGQFPSVTISFNLPPGVALGTAVTAVQRAEAEIRLPGTIRGSFQGTAQAFQASLANEPILIAAALLTVYLVLGILYESLIHPITILSTLPSAGVGALIALLICRTELSVIALIGIILLIGIVKKNAILMIDFAIEAERKEGKSPGGGHFPGLPPAFPADHDDDDGRAARRFAARARRRDGIGAAPASRHRDRRGLVFSQMLTLFTTPVVYLYLDRLRLRWHGFRHGGRRAAPGPGIAGLPSAPAAGEKA